MQYHQETLSDLAGTGLHTNPDTTYRNCAYYLGVSLKMVCNIVKLYCESGLQRTLTLNRNVNSDNATRKIDGAMEARIIVFSVKQISPFRGEYFYCITYNGGKQRKLAQCKAPEVVLFASWFCSPASLHQIHKLAYDVITCIPSPTTP